tara:strand:- start:6556 stop:9018 length:2463 start_codon:yes stop_codon:yes gene_type:complete
MRWFKNISIAMLILLSSLIQAEELRVDPKLSQECINLITIINTASPDDSNYKVTNERLNHSSDCISSQSGDMSLYNVFGKDLMPRATHQVMKFLPTTSSSSLNNNFQSFDTNPNPSAFEMVLETYYYWMFWLFAVFTAIRYLTELVSLAKEGHLTIKEALVPAYLYKVFAPILLLAPINGIPLIVYAILVVVLLALFLLAFIASIFTVEQSYTDVTGNPELIEEIEPALKSSIDQLVDNSLKLQVCDIENRKKLMVGQVAMQVAPANEKLNLFNQSELSQCLLETKRFNPAWNSASSIRIEDNYIHTSKSCFYDFGTVKEYDCGATIVSKGKISDPSTSLQSFFTSYTNTTAKDVREIANELVKYNCQTRDDIDRNNDKFLYESFCAKQDISGQFTSENGFITTYKKKLDSDIEPIIASLDKLKEQVYKDYLNKALEVERAVIKSHITKSQLSNVFFDTSSVYRRNTLDEEKYKSDLIDLFNSLSVALNKDISLTSQNTSLREKGLSDALFNSLRDNTELEKTVEDLVLASSFVQVTESETGEKLTLMGISQLYENAGLKSCVLAGECKTTKLYPTEQYISSSVSILKFSEKVLMSAVGIKAFVMTVEAIGGSGGIKSSLMINQLKQASQIMLDISLVTIISIFAFIGISYISVTLFFGFKIFNYIIEVIREFIVVIPRVGNVIKGSDDDVYSLSSFITKLLYFFLKPVIIGISMIILLLAISLSDSILSATFGSFIIHKFIDTEINSGILGIVVYFIGVFFYIVMKIVILLATLKLANLFIDSFDKWIAHNEMKVVSAIEQLQDFLVAHLIYKKSGITK